MATLMFSSIFIPRNASSFCMNSNSSIIITNKFSLTIFQQLINKLPNQPINNPQAPKKSLCSIIFNTLDTFICNFIDSPLQPSHHRELVLSGNFTPVEELPPTACDVVEGSLPSCLNGGAYIRNGPNPQFLPKGPYHLFEGDGMLHTIKFSQGNPTFCCRYVNTHKLTVEREAGYPFVPSIFSSFNGGFLASIARTMLTMARILAGQFDPLNHGFGTGNTSLALFSGHLYALCEFDLPYEVSITKDGDIITLGRRDFGATEPFSRMTAHPKIDSATGEVFAYSYDGAPPFLRLFRIDSNGRKQNDVSIYAVEKLTPIHDFAMTENYVVIPDTQIVVSPREILRGRSPVGVDRSKVARLGIIQRYAEEEEMVWIEAAGFNPFHCVNAWEEDGGAAVCMVASNALAVDQVLENIGCAELKLEMIRVNVEAKTVQRRPLSSQFLDLGVINPAYAAKRNRYVYAIIVGKMQALGVVKLDLSLQNGGDCVVASREYGPSCHGGETLFVAREPNNPAAEEDDGYLITYLHDENSQESRFVVMDAKTPNLDIIAAVKLPQRIPTGFHGLFLSENDITNLTNNY